MIVDREPPVVAIKAAAGGVVRALSYDHSSIRQGVAAAKRPLTAGFLNDSAVLMNRL